MISACGVAVVGKDPAWTEPDRDDLTSLDAERQSEPPGLLISIQSRYAAAIMAGHKTVELRRRPPKSRPPVVVIYGSGGERAIVGTARLRAIHTDTPEEIWTRFGPAAGVTRDEFDTYFSGCKQASALELIAAAPATERLTLDDLRAFGLQPPQSWRYVDAEQLCALVSALHPRSAVPDAGLGGRAVSQGRLSLHGILRPWGWTSQGLRQVPSLCLNCLGLGLRTPLDEAQPIDLIPGSSHPGLRHLSAWAPSKPAPVDPLGGVPGRWSR